MRVLSSKKKLHTLGTMNQLCKYYTPKHPIPDFSKEFTFFSKPFLKKNNPNLMKIINHHYNSTIHINHQSYSIRKASYIYLHQIRNLLYSALMQTRNLNQIHLDHKLKQQQRIKLSQKITNKNSIPNRPH